MCQSMQGSLQGGFYLHCAWVLSCGLEATESFHTVYELEWPISHAAHIAVYDEALHNWPLAWAASVLCSMLTTLSIMSFDSLSNLLWKQHSVNLLSMCLTWQHFLQQLNWWSKGKSEGEQSSYIIGQQFSWSQVLNHCSSQQSLHPKFFPVGCITSLTQMQVCRLYNAILSMVEKILGSTPNHEQVWFFLPPVLPSCITYSHMPCQAIQALQEVNSQDTWSSPKTEPCHWEKILSPARVHCVVLKLQSTCQSAYHCMWMEHIIPRNCTIISWMLELFQRRSENP